MASLPEYIPPIGRSVTIVMNEDEREDEICFEKTAKIAREAGSNSN